MAGGLAQVTTNLLANQYPWIKVYGVDSRPPQYPSIKRKNITSLTFKYTRGNFEKLFRDHRFDCVLHLGRMSHARSNPKHYLAQRLDLNIMGTGRILELCRKFKVKKNIIVSTYHVYGAYADNCVFIKEDQLLRAAIKYPDLRDVVEMDQLATNWAWKNQHEVQTVVLRPCSIIGPHINNAMKKYLTTPMAPVPIDYNPFFQFIHEYDMARVLLACLEKVPTGVYNVTTDEAISIKDAKKIVGARSIPTPIFLFEHLASLFSNGVWSFPTYLLDYLKYSCLMSNSLIKQYIGDEFFKFTLKETLEILKVGPQQEKVAP